MSQKKKPLTIGVLVLLVVLFFVGVFVLLLIPNMKKNPGVIGEETAVEKLVNSVSYSMVSELQTEEAQRELWEQAIKNLQDKETFEIKMEIQDEDTEGVANIKIDGEDVSMHFDMQEEGQDMEMNIVKKDNFVYFGVGGDGFKVKAEDEFADELETQFGIDEFRSPFHEEDWDDEQIAYKGLESVGSRKYHTYYSTTDDTLTWIDALAILPVKFQDGDGTTGFFLYHAVNIEAPVGYEDISDLSEEEQGMKFFELFFSGFNFEDEDWDFEYDDDYDDEWEGMDWDYDWDDDWDDEDWEF